MYRDPELTRLAAELLAEKTRAAILVEENQKLRGLLFKEEPIETGIVPVARPLRTEALSRWQRFKCFLGYHDDVLIVDWATLEASYPKRMLWSQAITNRGGASWKQKNKYGQKFFDAHCRGECKHCSAAVFENSKVVDKADFESSLRICNMVENARHEYEGNFDDFFWAHQINLNGEIIRRDNLEPTYRACG